MVADDDDFRAGVDLAGARRDLAHRHMARAGDAAGLEFPGLAHVEQQRLRAARVGEPGGQLRGRDLFHGIGVRI